MLSSAVDFPEYKKQLIQILSCVARIKKIVQKIVEQIERADQDFTGSASQKFSSPVYFKSVIQKSEKNIKKLIALLDKKEQAQFEELDFSVLLESMDDILKRHERLNFFVQVQFYFLQIKKEQAVLKWKKSIFFDSCERFFNSERNVMLYFRNMFEDSAVHVEKDKKVNSMSTMELFGIEDKKFTDPICNIIQKGISVSNDCFDGMKAELINVLLEKPMEEEMDQLPVSPPFEPDVVSDVPVVFIVLLIVLVTIIISFFYLFPPLWAALFLVLSFIGGFAFSAAFSFYGSHSSDNRILKNEEENENEEEEEEKEKEKLEPEEEKEGGIGNDLIAQIQTAILFVMGVECETMTLDEKEGEWESFKLIDELQALFSHDYIVVNAFLIDMQEMICSEQPNAIKEKFNDLFASKEDQLMFQENLKKTIDSLGKRKNERTGEPWPNFLLPNSLKKYSKMKDIFLKPQEKIDEKDLFILKFLIKVGGPQLDEALLAIRLCLELDKERQSEIKLEFCEEAANIFFKELPNNKVSTVAGAEEKYGQHAQVKALDHDLDLLPVSQPQSKTPQWRLKTEEELEADLAPKNRPVLIGQLNTFLDSVLLYDHQPGPGLSAKQRRP